MSLLSPNTLRDDRGAEVSRRDAEIVSNLTGAQATDLARLAGVAAAWSPLLLPLLPVAYTYATTGRFMPASFATLVSVPLAFSLRALLLRHLGPFPGFTLSLPTLLAHGRCAVCGYKLGTITPALDERVVCPECGAAWHPDRMPFAHASDKDTVRALRLAASRMSDTGRGWRDDRGVVLKRAYQWPRGIFRSVTPTHPLAAAARQRLNRMLGIPRRATLVALWILGGLIGLLVLTVPTLRWGEKAGWVGMIATTCLIIHALVSLARLPREDVRGALLRGWCCPSCWGTLVPRVMDFDRRTRCPSCRAAWKVADIGERVAPRPNPSTS